MTRMGRRAVAKPVAPSVSRVAALELAASPWLQPRCLAVASTLAALGVSLLFLRFSYMIDYDFYVWIQGAKALQREGLGALGQVYKEPLLSFLLNLTAPIFGGDYEQAGKAISVCFGSLAIGLLFLLAYELFGSRLLAACSALLVALHPQIIYYNTHPFSEALYLSLIMLAFLLFWRAPRGGGVARAAAAGLALGLAFLTRIPGIASALALFAFSLAVLTVNRFRPASAVLRFSALALGFLLVAGPFWLSIRYHKGEWRLSNKVGPNLLIREVYSAHDPGQKVEDYERLLYGSDNTSRPKESGLLTSLVRRPLPVLAAYRHQLFLGLVLAHWVFPLVLVTLGLIAVAISARAQPEARMRGVVYLSLLAPLFAYPLGHVERRYMVPLIPVFVLLALEGARWAAAPLTRVIRLRSGGAAAQRLGLGLAAGAAALIILAWSGEELLAATRRTPWNEPIELKQAGLWLKAHAPPDAVIMARKPMTAFYADRPWVALPYTDYGGLLRSLREQRVSHLVMDEIFAGRLRPQLRFLLYEPERIKRLTELVPVHVVNERRGRAVIIYQVNRDRLPAPSS